MINYFQIHADQIMADEGLLEFKDHLEEYKAGDRHDVFDNLDIFSENCRSIKKQDKDFRIFRKVNDQKDSDVVIYGLYLEMLQFWGQEMKILEVIKKTSEMYSDKCVVFQWNHDVDFAKYSTFVENFKNVVILNFNTSRPTKNDIILPFWSINTEISRELEDKTVFASLCCSINNPLRYQLAKTIVGKPGFLFFDKLPHDQYEELLRKSLFTFCPRGHGLSSYRFFESLSARSIPVLLADDVTLPFQDSLNYDEMIVRIPENRAADFDFIIESLRLVDSRKMLDSIDRNLHAFGFANVQRKVYEFIKNKNKELKCSR